MGLNTNKDLFVDEWNYSSDWKGTQDESHTAKAIGFSGKALSKFINVGVGADYFMPQQTDTQLPNIPVMQ